MQARTSSIEHQAALIRQKVEQGSPAKVYLNHAVDEEEKKMEEEEKSPQDHNDSY